MATGTVKWYSPQKSFGFLIPDAGGNDVFCHVSALQSSNIQTLADGQKVSFELAPDRVGRMCAADLKVIA